MTDFGPTCNCGSPWYAHLHGISSTTSWSYRVPVEPLALTEAERQAFDEVNPDGVWVAYNYDGSAFVPFATELEALRYAADFHMPVKFVALGDPDWMNK